MSPRLLLLPLLIVPMLASVLLGSAQPAHAASVGPLGLRNQVERALQGSTARSVSASVDVDGLGAVDRRLPNTALPPASTEKLFTAETALRTLGAGYRQDTTLRSAGTVSPSGRLLTGDLYLVASGDPYFTSDQLMDLATSFAKTGVVTIAGHLVVDDTRYDRARRAVGWKSSFVPDESGPVSAMALDENGWRRDSAYIADPATPVLAKLRADLAHAGVRLTTSDARRGPAPARATTYANEQSAPLSSEITRILKESDNFAAELLLKEIGHVGAEAGTDAAGAQVVQTVLGNAGVSVGKVLDGPGLSYDDRQTTLGELELLNTTAASSTYGSFEAALPIGCRDGTLKHRFCGTVASGRVFAKTGTLDTSRALAGWTYTRNGHLVTFSFLLSGFSSGSDATAAIDRAVVVLAGATTTS